MASHIQAIFELGSIEKNSNYARVKYRFDLGSALTNLLWTSYPTDEYLTALASQSESGTQPVTRILLSNYVPSIDYFRWLHSSGTIMPTRTVKVQVSNLAPGYYLVKKYLIDHDNSNSCSLNKATESSPSNAVCGTNGVVEKQVNRALAVLSSSTPNNWGLYFSLIDQINNQPGVALFQQPPTGAGLDIIYTTGTYQESVVLQPYSVLLFELVKQ